MKNPGWSCFDFTLHDYTNTPEMLDHVNNDRNIRVPFARRADPRRYHADTPAQPETHWTARPSVELGLGVEEAGLIADRKSRTDILWPSSQRPRHRSKGRLSLGDPVGRTR